MNAKCAAAAIACLVSTLTFPVIAATGASVDFADGLHGRLDLLLERLVTCPPLRQRFVDNQDGTICDTRTGLMWEKKNAADGMQNLSNPHDVDNLYTWSSGDDSDTTDPDGTAFTNFLARLNGDIAEFVESEQLAGYRDWRLPTLAELQTLHPRACEDVPCVVHPLFLPTAPFLYWTSTSLTGEFLGPAQAWGVFFNTTGAIDVDKSLAMHVRAVRGGP